MSDIVERLLSQDPPSRKECADTITALRGEVERLNTHIANDADWKFSAERRLQLFREQRQNNAALTDEVKRLRDGWAKRVTENIRLNAEVARLREALNKAAHHLDDFDARSEAREARAALSPPPAVEEKTNAQT